MVYHVGYCPDDDVPLPPSAVEKLVAKGHGEWARKRTSLRKQPPGNPTQGWSLTWEPKDGDVHAAGPHAQKPFRLFASSEGPCAASPPYADLQNV